MRDGALRGLGPDEKLWLREKRRDVGRVGGAGRLHVGTIACGTTHPGPDTVVAWRRPDRVAAVLRMGRALRSSAPVVRGVRIRRGRVLLQVINADRPGDYADNHIGSARLVVGWRRGRLAVLDRRDFSERPDARRFVSAIRQGRGALARRLGSAEARRTARQWFVLPSRVTVGRCVGPSSPDWPVYVDQLAAARLCRVDTYFDGGGGASYGLAMGKRGWNTYRVKDVIGIAG